MLYSHPAMEKYNTKHMEYTTHIHADKEGSENHKGFSLPLWLVYWFSQFF